MPLNVNKVNDITRSKKKKVTKFRGVSFKGALREGKPWVAQITSQYELVTIGHFKTDKEAAIAYDKVSVSNFLQHQNYYEEAIKLWGEKAQTNFGKGVPHFFKKQKRKCLMRLHYL